MLKQECDRLYALALRLVPDPDAAGDLFMDARNEADLRRRAARWRRQHGLPEAEPEPAPDAAPVHLTEEESEHAAHLARRGRRRRRARGIIAGGAAAAVLLGTVYLLAPMLRPPSELAMAEQFHARPVAATEATSGVNYIVYRAEATPAKLTLWWGVEGPGAGRLGQSVTPELLGRVDERTAADTNETAVAGRSKVLGRTTFNGTFADETVRVAFTTPQRGNVSRSSGWQLGVPIEKVADPRAREIPVDRTISVSYWNVDVRVISVTVAPDYTLLRYVAEGPHQNSWTANVADVEVDGQPLTRRADWERPQEVGPRAVVYTPVPVGASKLKIGFPGLAYPAYEEREYPLPNETIFPDWIRTGSEVKGRIAMPKDVTRVNEFIAWAVDRNGQQFTLVRAQPGPEGFVFRAPDVPPDGQLVKAILGIWHTADAPVLEVGL